MARGKVGTILIKMLSTAGTGYFYVKARAQGGGGWAAFARCAERAATLGCVHVLDACVLVLTRLPACATHAAQKKNPKKLTHKLEFMKYDPRVMKHVLFTETKLK
jgi:large subunit ribosomal protein L33